MNNLKINTDIVIGYNHKNNKSIKLTLDDRLYNTLIVGPTGSNKTGFSMKPLIKQDVENNSGVVLIEPKGDLSCDLVALCKHYNREVLYFSPCNSDKSTKFNPLCGDKADVSKILLDTFLNYTEEKISTKEKLNLYRTFNYGLTLLKSTYSEANLKDFYFLLSNQNGFGEELVYEFMKKSTEKAWYSKPKNAFIEELEIANYFINYYKNKSTKSLESKIDSILEEVIKNKYLSKVLVLDRNEENELDFDYALSNNIVLSLSTAQGYTRHLGSFIGELLVNTLVSSIFNSSYRKRNTFKTIYLDESQVYLNNNYIDLLKTGRSYNISSVLTLQNTEMLLDFSKTRHLYLDTISNTRNTLIYPGLSHVEAEKYASNFNHYLSKKGITNKFTAEDLVFRKFGQITALTVKDKDFTAPQIVDVKFIEKEVEEIIQSIVKNTFFHENN